MSSPSIESAHYDDWPQISALLERSALPSAGIDEHLQTALVAREDGLVVGSVALELYGADALLRSLAVAPARRGTGLGLRLTTEALALARGRGVERIYLLTETAAPFFRRLGFRDVARADVPERVRGSLEFASLCPASAEALLLAFAGESGKTTA